MDVLDRARGNIILFSLNPNNKKIVAHIRGGGKLLSHLINETSLLETANWMSIPEQTFMNFFLKTRDKRRLRMNFKGTKGVHYIGMR